ncbi:response regulator [Desulfogranum mediterraneum]|uniref:hypothetical protein n=1 Tax=Desulfogranum mediterraneum TaxID=160661 RepID=UPI001294670A|nr:hypothetical protein [Desulfogranum mediterraneum]
MKKIEKESFNGRTAFDLFPDVFEQAATSTRPPPLLSRSASSQEPAEQRLPPATSTVAPPEPLPLEKILQDASGDSGQPGDGSKSVLLYIPDQHTRSLVAELLRREGFSIYSVESAESGIEKVQSLSCSLVICDFADATAKFHDYICWLPMERRRTIFYVLLGRELHTLYDLEALSLSANLTVGYKHLECICEVLDVGLQQYEKLFQPLFAEIDRNAQASLL